jgi:hypothetical protein
VYSIEEEGAVEVNSADVVSGTAVLKETKADEE